MKTLFISIMMLCSIALYSQTTFRYGIEIGQDDPVTINEKGIYKKGELIYDFNSDNNNPAYDEYFGRKKYIRDAHIVLGCCISLGIILIASWLRKDKIT
jgi:hypothetical protein